MTSILTNTSAISAVASLTATQKSLADVQNQISTGLKVSSAKDNAAYYAIATNLRTQVGNLGAVSDSLNLGSSVVNTASAAVTNVTTILQSISSQLVAAKQPGTNLDAIQSYIEALNTQLGNTVSSASFNGVNLIDGSTTTGPQQGSVQFVAGVTGLGADTKVTNLTVDTTGTNLAGIYTGSDALVSTAISANQAAAPAQAAYTAAKAAFTTALTANGTDTTTTDASFIATFGAGATFTATTGIVSGIAATSVAGQLLGSGGSYQIVAGTSTAGTVGNFTTGASAATGGATFALYGAGSTAVTQATVTNATANASSLAGQLNAATTALGASATSTATYNQVTSGSLFQVGQISLTSGDGTTAHPATTSAQIDAYIAQVGRALASVTTASETFGAAAKNIDLQSTYTTSLSNSITTGVGSLVDADLNQASTRLNALQTQQQLGIQALSIANSNTQLILKLFQ